MITVLERNRRTRHNWFGRDDHGERFHTRLPLTKPTVAFTLSWRKNKNSKPHVIGKFEADLAKLAKAGYVRTIRGYYLVRFQRNRNRIELAINHDSRSLPVGRKLAYARSRKAAKD